MIPASSPGPRRTPGLTIILATIAAASLPAAACSSSSTSHDSHSSETQRSSDSNRETAESRLEQMGPQLGTVLTDYRAGKKTQAYTLTKSVSAKLYEGTTEGIVSSIDPAVERQIDSLLAATLPAAIKSGQPAGVVMRTMSSIVITSRSVSGLATATPAVCCTARMTA